MKIRFDIAKQNTPEAIQLLSAQRHLYSQAKFIEFFSFLSTLAPIILVLFIKNRICIQFITIIITVVSLLLTQWSKDKIKNATRIQEKFDTLIFGLNWNKILVGREPSPEIINKFSQNKNQGELKDWYPNPNLDSAKLNIIICQRSNVIWNIQLHKICSNVIGGLLCMFLLLIIAGITFKDYMWGHVMDAAIVTTIPIVIKFINYWITFKALLDAETQLINQIDDIIHSIDKNRYSISVKDLRSIQDFIFVNIRSATILVPNWLYFVTKKSHEEAMKSSTKSIADNLKRHSKH
ncbi:MULTISPECIES: S-4TM family putative pore-forming effector [Lactobacillaceae]|uniref:S-4TM family putative pore-forming effector n=2 Tax=Lactobacillales TaxID=186826 RepID=UPI0015C51B09|nr:MULTISPECIES: S-4TM family putative pore-forming effector [Lactobacillaceae]MCC9316056.1 hypothetical protein [Lactiplantibacillus plantarum]MCG0634923.1 hypothetical protein [Lactiplantibacillus plantarum]WNN66880.1 S-4TM family putative pore-forming effector [Levilactobacillus namurensis]